MTKTTRLTQAEEFFDMERESAMHLTLRIHNEGIAECGTYSHEVAKAKATQVVAFAHEHRHPLQCASGMYWPAEGCFCVFLRSGGRHRVYLLIEVDRK